jgi:hypothetical protein
LSRSRSTSRRLGIGISIGSPFLGRVFCVFSRFGVTSDSRFRSYAESIRARHEDSEIGPSPAPSPTRVNTIRRGSPGRLIRAAFQLSGPPRRDDVATRPRAFSVRVSFPWVTAGGTAFDRPHGQRSAARGGFAHYVRKPRLLACSQERTTGSVSRVQVQGGEPIPVVPKPQLPRSEMSENTESVRCVTHARPQQSPAGPVAPALPYLGILPTLKVHA